MFRIVQKYQFNALKNHETAMVSMVLSMNHIRVVNLGPRRELIAFPAPQLQWQAAVSWSALLLKKKFRIVSITKGHSSTSAFT